MLVAATDRLGLFTDASDEPSPREANGHETFSEFPGPTPQLVVADDDAAIQFYQRAFGADELVGNRAADGRLMHCEQLLFGGRVLVVDDFEADPTSPPTRLGGTTVRLHLNVRDVDEVYAHAIAVGATEVMQPRDAFWDAIIQDPAGHLWSLGAGHDDLTIAEVENRADTWSHRPST